jgi:predicted ATPase/DNA-binding SARP family transcriptional activator
MRRAFISRLALARGESVPTERLVADLWGERPPSSALNLVHTYVSLWRRTVDRHLGPGSGRARIARVGGGYRLDLHDDELDVAVFLRLVARGRRALEAGDTAGAADLFHQALAQWRGDALSDLGDVAFQVSAAARLDADRRRAVLDWATAALAADQVEAVVGPLRVALDRSPLDEEIATCLMRATYLLGRQSDALAVFDATRRALADHLGIDPGPQLAGMHVQVLRQDAALGVRPPPAQARRALPLALDRFVGRERELAELRTFLTDFRLVTVVGAAGSGKTRVALEVAARMADVDVDDVRFVDASVLSGSGALLARLAANLEVSPVEPQTSESALHEALAGRAVLLVLDNLEHLATAATDVSWLLSAGPGVRILATSRTALRVAGERRFPLAPLDVAPRRDGAAPEDRPMPGSADDLFVDRACAVDPTFRVDAKVLAEVNDICRRLDGLPLAVELAAGWLTTLPLHDLAEQLAGGLGLLLGASGGRPDGRGTLRAAMDWSYRLLDDEGRRLFRTMAVFRGGCDLDAVVGVASVGRDETLHRLRDLVDRSLLVARPSSRGARFAMLEAVRAYAEELLRQAGEVDTCRDRHGEHYLRLAATAGDGLNGAGQAAALGLLDADLDNVYDAISWCARGPDQADRVVTAAARMWRYWHLRSRLDEGRALLEGLLGLLEDRLGPSSRAAATSALGSMHYWRLGHAQALGCYREAVDWRQRAGDDVEEAVAWCDLAYAQVALGAHEAAWAGVERAKALYEKAGDERGRAGAVSVMALLHHVTGQPGPAIELAGHALAALRGSGDEFGTANTRALLGSALRADGRLAEAEAALRLAVGEHQRLGNASGIAWCLVELAAVALATGDGRRALLLGGASDTLATERFARIPFSVLGLEDVREGTTLGAAAAGAAWNAGRALSIDDALRLATGESPRPLSG